MTAPNGDTEFLDDPPERGVLELLSDIRSGRTPARAIDQQTRRDCVEYLTAEGVTVPEIAQLLDRNERTIRRDIEHIRESNALRVDEGFSARMAGELLCDARTCISRIRRVSREREAPHAARIDAERAVFEIRDRLIARLQNLGYLPSAAQKFQGELTHKIDEPPSFDEIKSEIMRLSAIESSAQSAPGPSGDPQRSAEAPDALELPGMEGGAR